MKVESIVFDCPLLFRGDVDKTHSQRIIAPSMEHYLWNNNVFKVSEEPENYCNQIYLITVRFNEDFFVIQKSRKLKKLARVADKLSSILDADVVIVKVTHIPNGNVEMKPIHVADRLTEDGNPDEE